MQIHEITKLSKKRTDEGLLDTFKDAVGITPKAPDTRTFMQKLKGEAPNKIDFDKLDMKDPKNQKLKAQQDAYQAAQNDKTKELEKYWSDKGYDVGDDAVAKSNAQKASNNASVELDNIIAQVAADPKAQQIVDKVDDEFAIAMPGYELKVHSDKTNGDYFKDEKGNWWNDDFPRKMLPKDAVAGLEQLAQQGKAKEQPSPSALAAKQKAEIDAQKKGGKKPAQPAQPVNEAKGDRKLKTTFYAWVRPKVEVVKDSTGKQISLNAAINDIPQLKKRLNDIFNQLVAGANDKSQQEQVKGLFKKFVTTALAGLYMQKKRLDRAANPDSDAGDDSQEYQDTDLATGDVEADKLAKEMGTEALKYLARMPQEKVAPTIEKVVSAAKKTNL